MSSLMLIARLLRAFPVRYAVNVVLWVSIWTMPIIAALITRAFFERIETGVGFNIATLVALVAGYGVARLALMAIGMLNDVHLMFRVGSLMRRNMFGRVLSLPGAQALEQSPGEAISRFRDDVELVEETSSWTVDIWGTITFSVVGVAVMWSVSPKMTLYVFAPLVVVIALAERAGSKVRQYRTAAREATGRVTEAIGEIFGNVQAIKVADAEEPVITHFEKLNLVRLRAEVKDNVLTALLESVFWNVVHVGTGLILIIAAQELQAGRGFSVGDFALFVAFLTMATDAVHMIGLFIARLRQAGVSFDRMTEVIRGEPASALAQPRALHLTDELAIPSTPAPSADDVLRCLQVRGLTFHYPGTTHGIAGVDLDTPRGSFTVITGRIGSGKTTLLRALLGLVEADAGEIRWNDKLVDDPGAFFVPPRSAYTPQVPKLFSMSLRENLLLGVDADDEQIAAAVSAAVLDPDVADMPQGLDTPVGPLGVRLSGGQIQRAATARMLLRHSQLVVFDDVSSALDVVTESKLWDRLLHGDETVTSLVVSHRRPALRRADQIVVLEQGAVVAAGRHEDLLDASDAYTRLWHVGGD